MAVELQYKLNSWIYKSTYVRVGALLDPENRDKSIWVEFGESEDHQS